MGRPSPARVLLVVAVCFASGCARTAQTVSFKFVRPAGLPAGAVDDQKIEIKRGETVFVDARPIEPLAEPGYPPGFSLRAGETLTLVVRIVVGADGRVEDVRKSLADFSLPSAFSEQCLDAVKAAVAQWRFEPAQLAVVQPQPNGRPLIVSSTPTERPFEIAFTFSSSGRVVRNFSRTPEKADQ
jgi:hypothetical protein